jgi:hypothetical protein
LNPFANWLTPNVIANNVNVIAKSPLGIPLLLSLFALEVVCMTSKNNNSPCPNKTPRGDWHRSSTDILLCLVLDHKSPLFFEGPPETEDQASSPVADVLVLLQVLWW